MKTRKKIIVSLALLTCLIIAVCLGVYYIQYNAPHLDNLDSIRAMRVNLCIDYGNGTVTWFNNTLVPEDCDLLNATKLVAEVRYTYWPAYESSFVDAINGVTNNSTYFWMWYYWDMEEWILGPTGSDRYKLKPEETVMWRYEKPGM